MHNPFRRFSGRLENRFTGMILALTVGVLLVYTIVSVLIQDRYLHYSANESRGHLVAAVELSTANALWNFNYTDVEANGDALFDNAEVTEVIIRDERDREVYKRKKVGPESAAGYLENFERPINYQGVQVGNLTVVFSNYRIHSMLWQWGYQSLILFLILTVLLIATVRMISRSMVRELQVINRAAQRFAEGDFSPTIDVTSKDEVGELARSLESMSKQLKDAFQEVKESELRYRQIFNATNETIIIHDKETGGVIDINEAGLRNFGFSYEEATKITIREFSTGKPPYSYEDGIALLHKTITEGPQIFEWQAHRKNGELYWIEVSLREAQINGQQRVLAVHRDITERKRTEALIHAQTRQLMAHNQLLQEQGQALQKAEAQLRDMNAELEKRVAERTAQLEAANHDLFAANQELEAFSFSVSHDLRAPLRSIDGFSHALEEDMYDKVDEVGRDYLRRIHHGAQRMSHLIDDLLKFSRISRIEMHKEPIDLSEISLNILGDLMMDQPERKVIYQVQPGMMVNADFGLMRIALANLLSNAWKFSSGRAEAHIEVGSTNQNGAKVYYVRDNGTGFDMAYVDKLFGVFQRLHGMDFEGNGIGLTIVQRIISRHHGRVWAEGHVDKGATFYFTLG